MSTEAWKGSQTLLKLGNAASPEVFTTVFEVTSIGEIGQENDLLEATHMLSTAKEYIGGLPDGVEFQVAVNFKPTDTGHLALLTAQSAGTSRNFELVLPAGASSRKFVFSALVKGWRLPLQPNVVGTMTFNLKITGAIVGPIPS